MDCPFCKEDLDFDMVGLRDHLKVWCDIYKLSIKDLEKIDAKRIAKAKSGDFT